jgi:hypothetical protein
MTSRRRPFLAAEQMPSVVAAIDGVITSARVFQSQFARHDGNRGAIRERLQ